MDDGDCCFEDRSVISKLYSGVACRGVIVRLKEKELVTIYPKKEIIYIDRVCYKESLAVQWDGNYFRSVGSSFINLHKFDLKESIRICLAVFEGIQCGIGIPAT